MMMMRVLDLWTFHLHLLICVGVPKYGYQPLSAVARSAYTLSKTSSRWTSTSFGAFTPRRTIALHACYRDGDLVSDHHSLANSPRQNRHVLISR